MELPKTLLEAVRFFSSAEVCHDFMVSIRWPDGCVNCPACGGENVGEIRTRRMFQCKAKGCRKQFSVKVGTIFEDSPIGLDRWLPAVWCLTNFKVGISSCELARTIGVTQKTAWHMLHRIRRLLEPKHSRQLEGTVESDETFIGGKLKNMHKSQRAKLPKGRGPVGKAVVHGMLDRGGEVRVAVVPDQRRGTLRAQIEQHVKTGSVVYTDSLASYKGLSPAYFHSMIDHAVAYVDGEVHTNGMENFWALLKRMLGGTYVSVAPNHLLRYCVEETFRFNQRGGTDAARFQTAMTGAVGKRLQYKELTGGAA